VIDFLEKYGQTGRQIPQQRIAPMKKLILSHLFLLSLALPAWAAPVVIEGPHNCCGSCKNAITKLLANVRDVSVDEKKGTITAKGKSDARKAIEALMDGGFYATMAGESSKSESESKPTSTTAAKKLKSATVTGVHNCCLKCRNLISDAVKTVPGVTEATVEPEAKTFKVAGEFTKEDLIAALNKAGFNGKVK
jgi:copper chaperone CopZ